MHGLFVEDTPSGLSTAVSEQLRSMRFLLSFLCSFFLVNLSSTLILLDPIRFFSLFIFLFLFSLSLVLTCLFLLLLLLFPPLLHSRPFLLQESISLRSSRTVVNLPRQLTNYTTCHHTITIFDSYYITFNFPSLRSR